MTFPSPHRISGRPDARPAGRRPRVRKRGGQPYNVNARKHGMYSAHRPSALARISHAMSRYSAFFSAMPQRVLSDAEQNIQLLRQIEYALFLLSGKAAAKGDVALLSACLRAFGRVSGEVSKLLWALRYEQVELEKTALASFQLVLWNFRYYYRMKRDADEDYSKEPRSFRVEREKSGQKSIEYGWLTAKQWRLLAPLLPSGSLEKGRGRPSVSSRAVISAIFWKVSHGVSWDDLPETFPSKRTCRRYYRRWFRSGRLVTIYKVLMKDLLARGMVHPFDFVKEGCFEIGSRHRIHRTADCPDTWQTRTALLFMQQSYALIRRLRREQKNDYIPGPGLCDELHQQYLEWKLKPVDREN